MDQEFFVEKQDFTVIKEKIIKTDELLRLYNEKNEKLGRATQAFKNLKLNYEITLQEVDRLKMSNERLTDTIERLKPKYEQAESELSELRLDYAKVEAKYQKNLIESQLITSRLEDKLKPYVCNKAVQTTGHHELKRLYFDLNSIEDDLLFIKEILFKNTKMFIKYDLHNKLDQAMLKLHRAKESMYETVHKNTDLFLKQKHIEEENLKVSRLSLDKGKLIALENESSALKQQINNFTVKKTEKCDSASQTEVELLHNFRLREKKRAFTVCTVFHEYLEDCREKNYINEEDSELSLSEVFREMILPSTVLSPISFSTSPLSEGDFSPIESLNASLSQDNSISKNQVPNIIVTPPTPNVESNSSLNLRFALNTVSCVDEQLEKTTKSAQEMEICAVEELVPNTVTDKAHSRLENDDSSISMLKNMIDDAILNPSIESAETLKDSAESISRTSGQNTQPGNKIDRRIQRKFWFPYGMTTFVKSKRKPMKAYKESDRFRPRNDTILDALRTLQEHNINFTISNDPIPLRPTGCYAMPESEFAPNTFISKLECCNESCIKTNRFMKLRTVSQHEEPELLGFFNYENELNRPPELEKPKNSELHYLAEQIIKGLKELASSKRRRKRRIRASEFNSETEPELAKLFRDSGSVLGRNRKLLAAARGQAYESNEESNIETDSDLMVDSGLVTATPKNDTDSLSYCSIKEEDFSSSVAANFGPFEKERISDISLCPIVSSPVKEDVSISTQTSKLDSICDNSTGNIIENGLDLYKSPFCPSMVSPLASSTKSSPEDIAKSILKSRTTMAEDSNLRDSDNKCQESTMMSLVASLTKNNLDDSARGKDGTPKSCKSVVERSVLFNPDVKCKETGPTEGNPEKYLKISCKEIGENILGVYKTPFCLLIQNPLASSLERDEKVDVSEFVEPINKDKEVEASCSQKTEDCLLFSSENSPESKPDSKLEPFSSQKPEGSEDSYKIPVCPSMVSPLGSSTTNSPAENTKKDSCEMIEFNREIKPSFCQKISFDASIVAPKASAQQEEGVLENETFGTSTKGATAGRISERDIFGEISDSDDDSDLPPKPVSRKKRPLKRARLKTVFGNVDKLCDNSSCGIGIACNNKSVGDSRGTSEREEKKINVVQDILISKGRSVDLLQRRGPNQRPLKKLKVVQTTPDNILSQVIQDMTRTGPKRQALNRPVSNEKILIAESEQDKTADDLFWDSPRSPDVLEVSDRPPRLIPSEKPQVLHPQKVVALMDKLMVFSNEEKVLDEVIKEFAFQDIDYVVRIILEKLRKDIHDKANKAFPPSPPLTGTQRILLGFLIKLDKSTHPGILERFLAVAELELYNRRTCELHIIQPITRLYTAICKMNQDLDRMRKFICESFYFAGDFAVPILFTVLIMWPDVFPMESEVSKLPLAKVIVQLCYLKLCNLPGYNLMPLRDLLHKHYGYPTERWSCEEVFKETLVEYIRNPSIKISDFALLLYLKNKPCKWVYQKIKEHLIPLYRCVPEDNPNLKATLLILLANICFAFNRYEAFEWSVICEIDQWFEQLQQGETSSIVQSALRVARARLPRMPKKRKKAQPSDTEKQEGSTNGTLGSESLRDEG